MQVRLVREVTGRTIRCEKGILHHHFICDRCGDVEDTEWYNVPKPASGSQGKRIIRESELIFRGLARSVLLGMVPVDGA